MQILRIHTLKKGWHDRDYLLLHAAFQLLVDFVEQEKPARIVDWDADRKLKRVWAEIRALYRWWTRADEAKRPAGCEGPEKATHALGEGPGNQLSAARAS